MEAKDIVISIVVPLVVSVMSYFGSRRGTKVAREEFENRKEATPPELLRLEKWSTILKDSEEYPKKLKDSLDIETIYSTYNDVLSCATLENRVMKLGIEYIDVRDELIRIRPGTGNGEYSKRSWKDNKDNLGAIILVVIPVLIYIFLHALFYMIFEKNNPLENEGIRMEVILFVFLLLPLMIIMYKVKSPLEMAKNITFRNGYKALQDTYLISRDLDLEESGKERKERKIFTLIYPYVGWEKMHRGLSSWNYGLNIDLSNDPKNNDQTEYYI